MKQVCILLLAVILGCNASEKKARAKLTKAKVVTDTSYYKLPEETTINLKYEACESCSTYYHFAKDSMHPILARVLWKDNNGNDKEERYISYEGYIPATSLSFYDSAGRQTVEYYRIDDDYEKGDVTKTFNYYEPLGKLLKSVSFGYRRRLKKGVDKGIASPGGCIITQADYEENRSWEVEAVWDYKYNEQGKLIERIAPKLNSSQNRYQYEYDSAGRKLEEHSLEGDYLVWIEAYKYGKNGYEFTRTWFERDGTRRKEGDNGLMSVDTFRFKTDKHHNIIRETIIEEKGRIVSTDIKYYDNKDRIVRDESYDEKNKLLGFYIYKYATDPKSSSRSFVVTAK